MKREGVPRRAVFPYLGRRALAAAYSLFERVFVEANIRSGEMVAAIAKAIFHASGKNVDIEISKTILMFCAVGLIVTMMCASYGLDLSPGFF